MTIKNIFYRLFRPIKHKGSMFNCLRCNQQLKKDPPDADDMQFWVCPDCGSRYANEPGKALHDRWLMPITLPLYHVIFEKDPESRAPEIARDLFESEHIDTEILIRHINEELQTPKQKVSEIHNSPFLNEDELRIFLRRVSEELSKLV